MGYGDRVLKLVEKDCIRKDMKIEEQYIGIDIGGTKCAVVLGDKNARVLKKAKIATTTYEETLQRILRLVEEMITSDVVAIGISCGGPLDSEKGLILSPPNLPDWREVPIVEMLEKKFHMPVYLENDANACTVAEWKLGAGKGFKNVIFLTFGTGIGAGLILDGRLYTGACDMAGEIGHIRIYDEGHIGYGKEGAFEGYCSGGGIVQYGHGSAEDVAKNAYAGDLKSLKIFEKVGEDMGKGLSILIDILNPEVIILGSIYVRAGNLMESSMRKILEKETLSQSLQAVQILPAKLGESLGDMAALCVAYQGYK